MSINSWTCSWKECPRTSSGEGSYSVDEKNSRIASAVGRDEHCTIIGNTPIPPNRTSSWTIKVLKTKEDNGYGVHVGVAPHDIDQNCYSNNLECGWYLDCYGSTLWSGPPHNYRDRLYGPRKTNGQYVHNGDSIGIIVDAERGDLSFFVNGVNHGIAYEGIPTNKPLVPCVLLFKAGDTVELDFAKLRENVTNTIPAPFNIVAKGSTCGSITITWDAIAGASFYQLEMVGNRVLESSTLNTFTKRGLPPNAERSFRVRTVRGRSVSEWSDAVTGKTLEESFLTSGWKECTDNAGSTFCQNKFRIDERNPRVVTKVGDSKFSTIAWNMPFPPNKVTLWNIKIVNSKNNGAAGIFVGVAPCGVDQDSNANYNKCGWYLHCYSLTLYSGPPHCYRNIMYSMERKGGQCVHNGDIVSAMIDTTAGDLSFAVNGMNLGVAYRWIPLDRPLVPCVILWREGDSVEFGVPEVEECKINVSILAPSNVAIKYTTWDSVTLTWDIVNGASLYQVEVDGNTFLCASTANRFTKGDLPASTEHTFRVRAVKENSVGKWSEVVKERTQEESLKACTWKECPEYVEEKMRYSVDEKNPRIATIASKHYCTITGSSSLPANRVTSWNVRILKSKDNDGSGIYVGVAPSIINQNKWNKGECGWYFGCFESILVSGPPHNYRDVVYGPRKENGDYVHMGDSVGVAMDMTKGELSFALNGVNYGVAYEGIPLDRPLVPCVILGYKQGDSVEFDPSEVKENDVNASIPTPSNIAIKGGNTWDSIALTWDAVEGASFYQIEVDESGSWDAATTNTFTKTGLLPRTEHSFRIRAMGWKQVSKWSEPVKKRAQVESFKMSGWKECPGYVSTEKRYSIDKENSRIAASVGGNYTYGTIVGNMPFKRIKVCSWGVKILESWGDKVKIYIGVAPSDIDQNVDENFKKCGWYFCCHHSKLWSGPPHKYGGKGYGSKKKGTKPVHAGDTVGAKINTVNGELSFIVNGVDLGIAYERIPLDKPLVPCVVVDRRGGPVKLELSEPTENEVDSSIFVPSAVTAKNGDKWDAIDLTWDPVEGASFYQVETTENKWRYGTLANRFTVTGLWAETDYGFRVRSVRGSETSMWCDVVVARTKGKPNASELGWKACPAYVAEDRRYQVDERNARIATKCGKDGSHSVILSNSLLPAGKTTSWKVNVLRSKNNDGKEIYIGVAPHNIYMRLDSDYKYTYNKCGWYFDCYNGVLRSGAPHFYWTGKKNIYGKSKKKDGKYVYTKSSIGVEMDTEKGGLSFILNGVNLGVAYDEIPLDEPLVPCVLLGNVGDSVEILF